MFTKEDGEIAVKTARKAIESKVKDESMPDIDFPGKFTKEMGVFVTLNKYPSEDLRGCIGYPEATFKLKDALQKAAQSATKDPRFSPLREDELDEIIVEVTLLTPPQEIEFSDPEELPKKIECGRDGLIMSRGPWSGLLLPQVPVGQGWDEEEFLEHTCLKAGLNRKAWKEGGCEVKKFQGEIFREKEPHGEVVRKEIE